MKKIKNKILILIVKLILKIHSFCYRLISVLAKKLEQQGIHPKHKLIGYHRFFTDNITDNDRVLDIGCGNGALTFDLAKKAKKVVGIDLNKKNIEIAREKFFRENIEYIHGDALKNCPKEKFDVVVLSNILEHLPNRTEFLKSLKDKVDKFLIRVPMINRDWLTLYKKELGLEWRADKTHHTEYTLESFKEELARAGLNLKEYSIQFGEIWAIIY